MKYLLIFALILFSCTGTKNIPSQEVYYPRLDTLAYSYDSTQVFVVDEDGSLSIRGLTQDIDVQIDTVYLRDVLIKCLFKHTTNLECIDDFDATYFERVIEHKNYEDFINSVLKEIKR